MGRTEHQKAIIETHDFPTRKIHSVNGFFTQKEYGIFGNSPKDISKDGMKNLLCEQWLSKLGLFSLRKGRLGEGYIKLWRPQKGI